MKVDIFANNIDLTDDIYELVQKKLTSKLSKFLKKYDDDLLSTRLTLSKDSRWGFTAKLEMNIPKHGKLYAESKHKELAYAVTDLREEVDRRLRKIKEKGKN